MDAPFKNKKIMEVQLIPEVHFAIRTVDGYHTSPNFVVECHMDNVYKLMNPKTGEMLMVRVTDHQITGPLSAGMQQVFSEILGGKATSKAEVLSMSPSLIQRLIPPHTVTEEEAMDIIQHEPRLKS